MRDKICTERVEIELVRLEGVSSNHLFDILTDWSTQLQHTSIAESPNPSNDDVAVLEIQESDGRHVK